MHSYTTQSKSSSHLERNMEVPHNEQNLDVKEEPLFSQLGQNGGFLKNTVYKILMPEEVQKAVSQIRGNPLTNALAGHYIDRVVTSMNTGAENAMAEAKPIFVNAIKSMTITDAIKVVTGGESAATSYLKKTTTPQLKTRFQPVIKKSLDKININEPWSKCLPHTTP